jgi:hypothetical protein
MRIGFIGDQKKFDRFFQQFSDACGKEMDQVLWIRSESELRACIAQLDVLIHKVRCVVDAYNYAR